tara:strand:+ start:315 stop:890 length:576 start_codon:yes stop_codon:yes gene_type:complete
MKISIKNIVLSFFIFCLGIIFLLTNNCNNLIESFGFYKNCPNILFEKDNNIYLYNSRYAKIPGRNPIKFNNLDEYIQFLKWERSQNINCPVLFLQHSYDIQGNETYTENNCDISLLLNANRNDPPYNQNLYPGFDPDNQYIGLITPLDIINQNVNGVSASPIDDNWGGVNYTKDLVKKGYYKDNEVKIQVA